tara:strand:- start:2441 stop:2599 length:159 start_codon:yes stop_codon:yes gene_type:complete
MKNWFKKVKARHQFCKEEGLDKVLKDPDFEVRFAKIWARRAKTHLHELLLTN